HVAAFGPTQVRKHLRERREVSLRHGIVYIARHEHADAPYAVALLRPRRKGPRRRPTEPSDEFAPSKENAHLALRASQWIKPAGAGQQVTGRRPRFERRRGRGSPTEPVGAP